MSQKIYVGNLSYSVDSNTLADTFAEYGTVQSAKVIIDRDTNRSKGFAFVEMSTSEEAARAIAELNGTEGILVASKVADRVGITRSVIVNALRKFESAGVIESRSLGMKGTYIKILNDILKSEIDKI